MGLAQDYWKIGSTRFGRAQLTRDVSQPYLSMTNPVYWYAAGMQVSIASALAAIGTNQPTGLEYRGAASARFDRPQLTRGVSPYMPTPLYFNNTPGPLYSALASAVLAATGAETTSGTLASTLAALVLAGTGKETVQAVLATTLANLVLAGVGKETVTGSLSSTLASVVLAGAGQEIEGGVLDTTLASAVLAAMGDVLPPNAGVLDTTLASVVLAGRGPVFGTLATTLASAVMQAAGPPLIPGSMTGYVWSGLVDLIYNGYSWEDAIQIAASYSIGGEDVKQRNMYIMSTQKAMVYAVAAMPYGNRPAWYNCNGSFGLTQENWNQGLPRGGLQ